MVLALVHSSFLLLKEQNQHEVDSKVTLIDWNLG